MRGTLELSKLGDVRGGYAVRRIRAAETQDGRERWHWTGDTELKAEMGDGRMAEVPRQAVQTEALLCIRECCIRPSVSLRSAVGARLIRGRKRFVEAESLETRPDWRLGRCWRGRYRERGWGGMHGACLGMCGVSKWTNLADPLGVLNLRARESAVGIGSNYISSVSEPSNVFESAARRRRQRDKGSSVRSHHSEMNSNANKEPRSRRRFRETTQTIGFRDNRDSRTHN